VQVLGPAGLPETFQEGSLQPLPPRQQVHTFLPNFANFLADFLPVPSFIALSDN
jgi:hypothetical protein